MFNKKKRKRKADAAHPQTTQQVISTTFMKLMSVFDKDVSKLSDAEFDFCLIEILEMEVNNGGFDLYFVNSYGGYIDETIAALDKIGSVVFKNVLQKAKKRYPGGFIPKDRSKRVDLLMNAEGLFDELDGEFYAAYTQEAIHEMLMKYYNANKDDFR